LTIKVNLFSIILFFTIIHFSLFPMRFLAGINPVPTILLFYLIVQLVFVYLFFKYRFYFKKITISEFFLLIIPIISASLIFFIQEKTLNINYIMDILKPILFIFTILFFKHIDLNCLLNKKHVELLMRLMLIVSIVVIITLYFIYKVKGGFYLSSTNILILIPIFYYLSKNKKTIVLLSFISLFFSGKRAVLLGFIGSFFLYLVSQIKNTYLLFKFVITTLFLILVLLFMYNFGLFDNLEIIKKISTGIKVAGEKGILYAFGGRMEEILYSLKVFESDPILLLTGAGPGYTYYIETVSGLAYINHGVHFSPVGVYTIYGPIFFITLYFYIFKNLKKSYKILKYYEGKNPLVKTAALFVIANFVASFTAFSIFTPIYFAIFIGMINNKTFYEDDNIK